MSKNKTDNTEKYLAEFIKCKQSFFYFCPKYIKIELPGGDVPLNPYGPQKNLVNLINNDHHVLVLKSRQIGISTITQAYITWLVTFYDNVVIGIVSKDGPEATVFARKISSMIDKLPKWMRCKFLKRNEQSFVLSNGCECYAVPVNPKAPQKTLRGKSITFLVIDEAAFIEYVDEAWTSMVSALATNQKYAKANSVPYGTIILSTPNKTVGVGQWFYKRYLNAESGGDIFKPFVIHWRDVKELADDKDWYRTQCEMFGNDYKKIQQELELKFLPSGGSFFDEVTTAKLQDINIKPIQKLNLFQGELWKFIEPDRESFYLIGVDTAPEHGEDKSTIVILDYETMEQVADYQTKCQVLDFVKVIKVIASLYPGLIIVESNSYGNQVVEMLNDSEYCTRLYKEKRGKLQIPGLSTNTKTRPLMIDALYSSITEFPEIIKSKRLSLELIGLVTKSSGRVEADTGCHDDLAMATALCMYVRKYDPSVSVLLSKSKEYQEQFESVMTLNDNIRPDTINNSTIRKYVKEQISRENLGYVDIMDIVYGSDKQ